jgi:multidrug efflux pump subunit AcrA (membrane-fusion protein)
VSWIERVLEERLAQAARTGELSVPHLEGKPLADLDRQRQQGWWAEQFVARELSHDRRKAAESAAASARAGFWRAESVDELRERVGAANAAITTANLNLVDADRLEPFDAREIESRWRALHPDR